MTLQIGDPAPDFTLPNEKEEPLTLSSLKGQRVVIYFYPKDATPGCTKEACNFRDRWDQFEAHGIRNPLNSQYLKTRGGQDYGFISL